VLRTLSPLEFTHIAINKFPSDLHVLSTPPAFVLSQNQTLRKKTFRPITPNCFGINRPDRFHVEQPTGANRLMLLLHSKSASICTETDVGSHVSHISIFKEPATSKIQEGIPPQVHHQKPDTATAQPLPCQTKLC
jgi:hypothetical protein